MWEASATEKGLMIDVKSAREAYMGENINGIIWIRRKLNLAEAMRKGIAFHLV